eukprot:ANDGO_04622.mRNA.1 Proton/sulfate cotransporter 2
MSEMEETHAKIDGTTVRSTSALSYLEQIAAQAYFSVRTVLNFFPSRKWIPAYVKRDWRLNLKQDVFAGLTVGAMIIPNAMAYAFIAGLPPLVGVYTAFLSIPTYFFLGTSRHLAVGPIPLASLVTNTALALVGFDSVTEQCAIASLIAIFAGAMQFTMGITHFGGVLVDFLGKPVISGFTSAACIIIALSQIKYILGVHISSYPYAWQTFYHICEQLPHTNYVTFLFGTACVVTLGSLKKFKPRFPGALVLVVSGILISWYFRFGEDYDVDIVGDVAPGLPSLGLDTSVIPSNKIGQIFTSSIVVCLVAFMESYSVGRAVAYRAGYAIDGNQELVAIGTSGMLSGISQGFVAGGALARTVVNFTAGAQTLVGSLCTWSCVVIFLLLLTSTIYHLPLAALGAIILTAVPSLLDVKEARYCYKNCKSDFCVLLFAFLCTLIIGIEYGIFSSVALSVIVVIWRSTRPYVAVLGRVGNSDVFKDQRKFPEAVSVPHLLILRIESTVFFANATVFEDLMLNMVHSAVLNADHARNASKKDLESGKKRLSSSDIGETLTEDAPYYVVVLDASPMNKMDSQAMHSLETLLEKLGKLRVQLLLACVNESVTKGLHKSGIISMLPEKERSVFDTVASAVARAEFLISERLAANSASPASSAAASADFNGPASLNGNVNHADTELSETSSRTGLASGAAAAEPGPASPSARNRFSGIMSSVIERTNTLIRTVYVPPEAAFEVDDKEWKAL